MGIILVICADPHIRKFYVDNFVVRGIEALGIPALSDQLQMERTPQLILIWGELTQLEAQVRKVRAFFGALIPVVLVGREQPSSHWLSMWHIAAFMAQLYDSRQLLTMLQPWLQDNAPQNNLQQEDSATKNFGSREYKLPRMRKP
jgi:hypothetical protein